MKGIELAEAYYRAYGDPMLEASFPHLMPHVAVGLVGSGSECMGFDDAVSCDHDFEPGFCIFLPEEEWVDRRAAFALERAYAKLPDTFMGYKRAPLDPVGGNRHGVIRISDFLTEKTGSPTGELTTAAWLALPEQSLLEVTNGQLFWDGSGKFTAVRKALAYLPEDVRRKKLAGELWLMGQAGQYNYQRCLAHGETAAAQLAMAEFVKSAMHAAFLLNRRYMPYYKWSFRALRELPILSSLYGDFEYLLSSGNVGEEVHRKTESVEAVCAAVIAELCRQELTRYGGEAMEGHAYGVNDSISDHALRQSHVLDGV